MQVTRNSFTCQAVDIFISYKGTACIFIQQVPDDEWFKKIEENDGYILIPKDFVPLGAITEEHIKKMVNKMGLTSDSHNYSIAERKMIKFKKEIRFAGKVQMEQWIQRKSIDLNLRMPEDNRLI